MFYINKEELRDKIHAGERVNAVNRLAITFASQSYPAPFTVPVTLLGK